MARKFLFVAVLVCCLAGGTALAVNVGDVVETVGVGAVVEAISGPANDTLNKLFGNRHVPPGVGTKVVPVLSVGEKGYVGAAQVAGSDELVRKTKAVLQLETSFDNRQYRIKVLMPLDSVNPLEAGRVHGIGVSALMDVALSHNAYLLPATRRFTAGDALRGAAIVLGTREFSGQINDLINGVFRNEGASPLGVTKVVPYLSVGEKAYIGLMQVAGPEEQVGRVQAVWQYEDLFDGGRVRLRALVPSDSLNPLQIRRVKGVGCTAIIDAMALRAQEAERHPDQYRYFGRSAVFVGLGEDPHYRPPGWDRGRKTGWARHGSPYRPPGLSRRGGPPPVIEEERGRGEQHQEQHGRGRGRGRGRGH